MEQFISCPFCSFRTDSEYQIMLHMEIQHPDGEASPFLVKDDASVAAVLSLGWEGNGDHNFASCPIGGCGEIILITELDNHIEMHDMEGQDVDQEIASATTVGQAPHAPFDTKFSGELRNLDARVSPPGKILLKRQENAKVAWKGLFRKPETGLKLATALEGKATRAYRRLGKSELGPYANENQMPAWLVKLLESDGDVQFVNRFITGGKLRKLKSTNHAEGIIPVLVQLFDMDPSTKYVYVCHPSVKHVSKLRREGGFCGYRNIQMLTSYINGVESQGYENFGGKIPTIFDIQDYIERAWDLGINEQGRVETGGIRGTRKYIGTPDAQAMFCSLGIACDTQAFRPRTKDQRAHDLLFRAVENYFTDGCTTFGEKVRLTSLPPLYFQHQGHSMTIVGFERRMDGSKALIVFDPMFHDALNVTELVGQLIDQKAPVAALKAYRRGPKYLGSYNEFEMLQLTPPKSEMGKVVVGGW